MISPEELLENAVQVSYCDYREGDILVLKVNRPCMPQELNHMAETLLQVVGQGAKIVVLPFDAELQVLRNPGG